MTIESEILNWIAVPATVPPIFQNTFCSQCGREFGPGPHGYSHCINHQGKNNQMPEKIEHSPVLNDLIDLEFRLEQTLILAKAKLHTIVVQFNPLPSATAVLYKPESLLLLVIHNSTKKMDKIVSELIALLNRVELPIVVED